LRSKVEGVINDAWVFWKEKVRRWIEFIVLLFGVVFTARIAAQNRKLLRPRILRLRVVNSTLGLDPPWTRIFWKHYQPRKQLEKLKEFLSERGMEFWELARDGGTRPILLRNILSNSFLACLVISLFWFLHFV
jgi:hypothetical protein